MTELLIFFAGFAVPLVFFTDLTRNPFCFQQFLLAICVLSSVLFPIIRSIKNNEKLFPSTAADLSVVIFLLTCFLSFLFSYFSHPAFYRPAILNSVRSEILFLLCFCIPVYYLSAGQGSSIVAYEKKTYSRLLVFLAAWLTLWLFFPLLKDTSPSSTIIGKIFDPYGTLLFVIAFFAVRPVIKGGGRKNFIMLVLTAGIIASLYGIMQFFGGEIIWTKSLSPYGNRPVSTFGNPNFLSSFAAMLLPYAFFRLSFSASLPEKMFYGLAFFSYLAVLMCSMARSSWIGAAVALCLVYFCLRKLIRTSVSGADKAKIKKLSDRIRKISIAALIFVSLFPSGIGNFRPLLFSRAADLFSGISLNNAKQSLTGEKISVSEENSGPYGVRKINYSVYQRLVMWAGAWQMGLENPLLGKGFGQFELFNSFYQGRLLASFPELREIRTHANEAHNEIAQIWAETGLAGLAAAFLIMCVFARLFYNKFKEKCSERNFSPDAHYADSLSFIPYAAGLVSMAADNMINVTFHFAVPAAMFCWLAGAFVAEAGGINYSSCCVSSGKAFFPKFKMSAQIKKILCYAVLAAVILSAAVLQFKIFMRETAYFAGYKASREGLYVYAAKLLEKSLSYDSGDVNVAYELSNIWIRLSDPPQAEKYLRQALRANAGYDELFSNLAAVLLKNKRNAEALPLIRTSTIINPLSANSWNTLGNVYSEIPPDEENIRLSIADFAEAEKLYPEEPAYPNMAGYMYMRAGKYAEAASVLAVAVRKHPSNHDLCGNFILAASKSGTEKQTESWLREYYRFSGILGSFLDNTPQSETEKTLNELNNFIAANPQDFRLVELKAKFLFKLKNYDAAASEMKKVLDFVPYDADVRYGLAIIYETAGNKKQAWSEIETILSQHPKNSRAALKKKKLEEI